MCTTFVAKLVLGIVNTLIFLVGLAMFIIGLLIQTQPSLSKQALSLMLDKLKEVTAQAGVTIDTSSFSVADVAYSFNIALIIVGIFLASVSVLGLIGIKCDVKVLLVAYFVITLLLFLAQITVVLIAVINRNTFDDMIKPQLRDSITQKFEGIEGKHPVSVIWNGLMVYMHCCGVDSYDDFTGAKKWTKTINNQQYPLITPVACCKTIQSPFTCAITPTDSISYWNTGCYSKVWDFIISNSGIVIGIAIGVLLAQLVLLILTYVVVRNQGKVGAIV